MKAKRQLFIGTSLVVALSCGMAPLSAVATPLPVDAAPASAADTNALSDLSMSQTVIPHLLPGSTGTATIRHANNRFSTMGKGAKFEVTAPDGTTFTSASYQLNQSNDGPWNKTGKLSADRRTLSIDLPYHEIFAGGWGDIAVGLTSDTNNRRTGLVSGGKMTVTGGKGFPIGASTVFSYAAPDGIVALSMSQTVTPNLTAGKNGKVSVRLTNSTDTDTPRGAKFELKAPTGTTFADNTGRIAFSDGYGHSLIGALSTDKKTLTFDFAGGGTGYSLRAGMHVDIEATLISDADNNRIGLTGDGRFTIASGQGFPVGSNIAIAYDAKFLAPTLSQPVSPTLESGKNGKVAIRLTNPNAAATPRGAKFELKAPTGTTFADNTGRIAFSDGYGHSLTGALSTDKKTLTFDFGGGGIGYALEGRSYVDIEATLVSETDNTRSGRIADGAFTIIEGPAFTPGTSTPFSYNSEYVAPAPITLAAPAIGAEVEPGNPVFTGTGHPGATITVQGAFGTVLGSGLVDAQGKWSITSTVSLVVGSYAGNAKQYVNGTLTSVPFSFKAVRNTAVAIISPAIDATVAAGAPTFSGTGNPGSTVTVRGQFGTLLTTATVDTQGYWAATSMVSLVPGAYAGTATQDVDGKVTTAPFKFTVR